jgi:hypothetical protein
MSGGLAGCNECRGWLAVNVTVGGDDVATNEVIKGIKVERGSRCIDGRKDVSYAVSGRYL